jgi:glycosidase
LSERTESELIYKKLFLSVYPNRTVKTILGEKIQFKCVLDKSIKEKNQENIIIEVWHNLSGRYHGYDMKRAEEETYTLEQEVKHTGFFNATFRWRHEKSDFWHWYNTAEEKDFFKIHVDPEYINKSIVYNVFIRFFGQNKINHKGRLRYGESGTFDDLKKRLDSLKKLGINILYLNPVHPIGELYRNYNPHDQFPNHLQPGCPYSIRDYKAIDPEIAVDIDHSQGPYASLSDPMIEFKELVKEAHKRGIKVYMDLVFNHTSHDFVLQRLHPEWFLYKENIKNLDEPYLYPEDIDKGKPWGNPLNTFCPFDHGYWWEDTAQLNWEYMIPQASNAPPKNPTIKEMYVYFKSIPKYWIKHLGIDGFRCDVAYRVPPNFWKECISEARTFAKEEFAKNNHGQHRSLSGDVVFIAESYVDDLNELYDSGFTAVYGDFGNKLYSVLTLKGYLDYIYNISGEFFPENAKFFIFPECHDFHRNTTKILGRAVEDKVLSERANKSRWTLTATLPGIPMIFNGFEKLEWQPVNLFSYSDIDWESDKDLKKHIIKVNEIRNKHKALQNGKYLYIHTNKGEEVEQIFSHARISNDGKEKFIMCVNMDVNNISSTTIFLDGMGLNLEKKYLLKDLLNKKSYERIGREVAIILEPGESHIFQVMQK